MRGRWIPAKRMRTWSAMRDLVALTVTGPFSRAAATYSSNSSRSPGVAPSKKRSSSTTWHECGMLRVTNRCPHTGQVQSGASLMAHTVRAKLTAWSSSRSQEWSRR